MQPVQSRVRPPAIALAIVGGLNLLGSLVNFVVSIVFWLHPETSQRLLAALQITDRDLRDLLEQAMEAMTGPVGMVTGVAYLIVAAFVLLAAIQMGRLRAWPLAVAGSAAVLIPCLLPCCCCVINLPIGIWCLIVLLQPDVRAAFGAGGPVNPGGPIAASSSS